MDGLGSLVLPDGPEGIHQGDGVGAVLLLQDDPHSGRMLHLHPETGNLPLLQRVAALWPAASAVVRP